MIKTGKTAYLGLGSNLGEKKDNLKKALEKLSVEPGIMIEKYSSIYLTEPMGASEQSDFYNCAAKIMTTLSPDELLVALKKIEQEMGRHPDSHLQPRTIDIDILLYADYSIDTLELMIPHSRLTKRLFVLAPLLELEPELTHPQTRRQLREYAVELGESQRVEKVIDYGAIFDESTEND